MENEKYIVYGAGRIGREVTDLLMKLHKEVTEIWDRNPHKKGEYRGIPIVNPYEETKSCAYGGEKIVIGLDNPLDNEEIYKYWQSRGYRQIYKYSGETIVEEFCSEHKIEENCLSCAYSEICHRYMNENLAKIYGERDIQRENIVNALSVALTNRCTLNCMYCTQCTEVIRSAGTFYTMSLQSIKSYLTAILQEIPYIHQLSLTGGEALLCRELPEILEFLCNVPQIGCIKLLTTATVEMPDSLFEILKHPKLVTWIDVYGKEKNIPEVLQNNLESNLDKLSQNHILYKTIDNSNGTWYDLGNTERRTDAEENRKKNQECMFRKCLYLSAKGNLSWCNRNICCIEYGLTPDDKRDYCNLSDSEDSRRILEILHLPYLHGCEYCNGTSQDNIVAAGMQRSK
jgi:hypothetical protein